MQKIYINLNKVIQTAKFWKEIICLPEKASFTQKLYSEPRLWSFPRQNLIFISPSYTNYYSWFIIIQNYLKNDIQVLFASSSLKSCLFYVSTASIFRWAFAYWIYFSQNNTIVCSGILILCKNLNTISKTIPIMIFKS